MTLPVARLDDVCEINPRMPKAIADDAVASFLPMAAVSEDGHLEFEEQRKVREVKKGYTYFERGDLLLAKITPCFENGKATRTNSMTNPIGFGSTEFHVLRAGTQIDSSYLFHLIWNSKFRDLGAKNMTGSAGQKRVPADLLKRLEIPLPPVSEQRRIAAILDKADALRRKRKRALELLDGLTQSIFLEMFGDPKSVSSKKWPMLNFQSSCEDRTSQSGKIQRSKYADSGMLPVIDQGQSFIAGWTNDIDLVTEVKRAVIVFGDHTRSVKFVDFDFVVGADGAKVLVPKDCFTPRFFTELLKLMPIPDLGYSRHMRALKELRFPCPPMDMQRSFDERISVVRSYVEECHRGLQNIESLFSSLQHRAFSGQL